MKKPVVVKPGLFRFEDGTEVQARSEVAAIDKYVSGKGNKKKKKAAKKSKPAGEEGKAADKPESE